MAKDGVYAVVTGASSGLGKAFAELFAQDGVNLVLSAKTGDKLAAYAKELKKTYKIEIHLSVGDLSKTGVAEGLYQFVQAKKLDVEYLVNSAGFGDYGKIKVTDWTREKEMIGVNVTALTYLSKMFAVSMRQRGDGRIVNLASTASFVPGPRMAVYHATKHYVLALSQAMSYELKGTGVSVTAFCPGPTNTPFWGAASFAGSKFAKNRDKYPKPMRIATFGYNAMLGRKTLAIYGWNNRLRVFTYKVLPRKVSLNLIAKRIKG
jgi:hypothetical protein